MAHLEVTNVVLSIKPAFPPLGDELAWRSDVSFGRPLREGAIIVAQQQMRDSSEDRRTAVSKHWISPISENTSQYRAFFKTSGTTSSNVCRECGHTVHVLCFYRRKWARRHLRLRPGKSQKPKFFLKTTISRIRSDIIWLYPLCPVGMKSAAKGEKVLLFSSAQLKWNGTEWQLGLKFFPEQLHCEQKIITKRKVVWFEA